MRARRLSCVLRGSALRAEHLRMRSTAIVLAMPVHASCGHYDRVLHHNESLRMIPKSGVRFSDQDHAPRKKEAKRRKAQAVHCPHRSSDWEGARQRSQRGPLAFRRSAAALAPASKRQDSAQAALHAKHDAKVLPPLRIALKRGTSRAGHNAGRDDARTARERGYKPRPQEPHSPYQSAVTGDIPSWAR